MSGKKLYSLLGIVLSLAYLLFANVPRAHGQAAQAGAIQGSVIDPSGAAVPDAEVTVTNTAMAQSRLVKTNATGFYNAEALLAGTYEITIRKEGFKTYISRGNILDAGTRININATLELGSAVTEVNVTASAVKVETASGESGGVIGGEQISQLALNGRSFITLALLVPGVNSQVGAQERAGGGLTAQTWLSVNGLGSDSINFTVDGGYNMNTGCQCVIDVTSPIDTISEFRVVKSNFSAKYGLSGTANVMVETKSGGQSFHGNVYDYLRNDVLDAAEFFAAVDPVSGKKIKIPLRQNNFGFSINGPFYIPGKYNVDKKKTFFFVNEEWRRRRSGLPLRGAMIPQAMRDGDFSGSPTLGGGGLKYDSVAVDLLSQKFPSRFGSGGDQCMTGTNQLDPACFDSSAVLLMGTYWPLPNNPSGGFLNYINPDKSKINQRNDTWRVDHYFSEKLSVMGRVQLEIVSDNPPNLAWGPNPAPTTGQLIESSGVNGVLRFNANITPTTINQFTITHSDTRVDLLAFKTERPSGLAINYPFKNADVHNRIPQVYLSGGWAGLAVFPLPLNKASDGEWVFSDDFSTVKGNHVIQAGTFYIFGIKRQNLFSQTNGTFSFSGVHTNDPVADYLLGLDASYFQTSAERRGYFRYRQSETYIQDDWKVTRRLTLNLGLRHVYYSSDKMEGDGYSDFDPRKWDPAVAPAVQTNGLFVQASDGTVLTTAGPPADLLNGLVFPGQGGIPRGIFTTPKFALAPRFGFAWDIFGDGKTSLRGGYGIGYTRIPFGQYLSMNNLPFVDSITLLNGTLTEPAAGVAGAKGPSGLNIIGPPGVKFRSTDIQSWSLALQRELIPSGVLTIAYEGSGARHVKGSLDFNFPATGIGPSISDPNCLQPGQDPNGKYDFDPCINAGIVSPNYTRPISGWGGFSAGHGGGTYAGNSNYHSLQAGWQYRAGHGLTVSVAYTWSKTLTDVADRSYDGRNTTSSVQNPRAFREEYGPPGWDRTHIFSSGYVWDLPVFRNRNDFVGKAFGGWTFSGLTLIQSGFALAPALGTATGGLAHRPNCVGPITYTKTVAHWFDTSPFTDPAFGTFGNCGNGLIRGPGENTWNWAIYKSFPIGEKAKLQFRSEFFNIWNHPNFYTISTTKAAANFGAVTSALAPRILEFGLRLDF